MQNAWHTAVLVVSIGFPLWGRLNFSRSVLLLHALVLVVEAEIGTAFRTVPGEQGKLVFVERLLSDVVVVFFIIVQIDAVLAACCDFVSHSHAPFPLYFSTKGRRGQAFAAGLQNPTVRQKLLDANRAVCYTVFL